MELRIGIIRDMKAKFGDFVVSALAVAMPLGAALAGTYLPGEGDFDVSVWQTTGEKPFREILTSPFTMHAYTNRAPIDVDTAEVRGTFSWLGVSMTDSSCYLLSRLSPEKRRALLEAVFSPTKGAGLAGVRLNIGSSDYATGIYNYNENPGDVEMKKFSVARDDTLGVPDGARGACGQSRRLVCARRGLQGRLWRQAGQAQRAASEALLEVQRTVQAPSSSL